MDLKWCVILGPRCCRSSIFRISCFVCSCGVRRVCWGTNVFYHSLWLQRGEGMFYACLNMHLKSKSIRNDSENAKGFHQSSLIHDALRKATYFRANSCYHLGSTPPHTHTEVIFHLRTCTLMTVWGAAAGMDTHKSMFSTHAISKWRGRREYSI